MKSVFSKRRFVRCQVCVIILIIVSIVFCLVSCNGLQRGDYKVAGNYKRYMFACDLRDKSESVEAYRWLLRDEFPEQVKKELIDMGVLQMQIYQFQDRLLTVLETKDGFDLETAKQEIKANPAYQSWLRKVGPYLKPLPEAKRADKWVLLERVYKLEQKNEYDKREGYPQQPLSVGSKRFVDARELVAEPGMVQRYKDVHKLGRAWPGITKGIKDAGVLDLEIYLVGHRTFEFSDVVCEFDMETSWAPMEKTEASKAWGRLVGPIDKPFVDEGGKPFDNQIMEKIFQLKR